jgi:MFS family permease
MHIGSHYPPPLSAWGSVCWQALHGGPPALNHYPFEWGECTAADEFLPVAWALTVEMVGKSRAIATGLLANSNQLGAAGGASIGGIVLGDLIGNERNRSLLPWLNKPGFS